MQLPPFVHKQVFAEMAVAGKRLAAYVTNVRFVFGVGCQVELEVLLVSEPLLAFVASEHLYGRVCVLMQVEIVDLIESHVAQITLQDYLLLVLLLIMLGQRLLVHERLVTNIANKFLYRGVAVHVLVQICQPRKRFLADLTDVALLVGVNDEMCSQMRLLREPLPAHFALELLLFRMSRHVPGEDVSA